MTEVRIHPNPRPLDDDTRARVLAAPVFGANFTDHMVVMRYADGAWGPLEVQPFAPLGLSPATLALHYGQSVFEALKAYRLEDGRVALFRPDRNAARMRASSARLAIPALPEGAFELACALLAAIDRDWVSASEGAALYVRPFAFASEAHLSVRPAEEYLFIVIASPVAEYFGDRLRAISVAVEASDVRASTGGTGAVKFAGNYAAGFAAHGRAAAAGHDQVLWLDAAERRWVEELNAMNVVFVWQRLGRTVLTTPPLTGTILDGVTRDSLLTLARDVDGIDEIAEEPTSIDEVLRGLSDGSLAEVFACGTAAVVAPIGAIHHDGVTRAVGDGEPGRLTVELRRRLIDLQQGRRPDPDRWVVPVEDLLPEGALPAGRGAPDPAGDAR